MELSYDSLKALHRNNREAPGFLQSTSLRIHRALSWLQRSEQCDDADGQFIFLWVSFNAAYARDLTLHPDLSERKNQVQFLRRLLQLDTEKRFEWLLCDQLPETVTSIIENQYIYGPYWEFCSGNPHFQEWRSTFQNFQIAGQMSLTHRTVPKLLSLVFRNLYVLRNQMVHGSSTWNGGTNRQQVEDGAELMAYLVPIAILTMLENGEEDWGEAAYPVVCG